MPNPTPNLTAEHVYTLTNDELGVYLEANRRVAFEEAAKAVRSACKECDRPVKTRIIGWVDKGDQRLPVHQLDENPLECPGCGPALRAIRALAKEKTK